MNTILPTKIFLTKGMGQHREKLASFEIALREAGIAPYNLVKITSIFPPNCSLISREEGLKLLQPGQILFLVMSDTATEEAHRLISASIGLAQPSDPNHHGYLAEHHAFGMGEEEAGEYAADLAAYMLATTLGESFDTKEIWNEKKNRYDISSTHSVRTQSITQIATGKKGLWTTAVAAAVCLP
ncbi:MAG: arginine decarboxylase, pyruvoyl-dependent [Candidatus Aminicenantes bacterium]|jgi:arginine decarboxylase